MRDDISLKSRDETNLLSFFAELVRLNSIKSIYSRNTFDIGV